MDLVAKIGRCHTAKTVLPSMDFCSDDKDQVQFLVYYTYIFENGKARLFKSCSF